MSYLIIIFAILGFAFRITFGILHKGVGFFRYWRYRWINYKNRGVRNHHGRSEQEILQEVHWHDNLMVTGNSKAGRTIVLTQLADQLHKEGIPVLVLHRGNAQLEQGVAGLGHPDTVICNRSSRRYDPLKNHHPSLVPTILFSNGVAAKRNLAAASKEYVRGITDMYAYGSNTPVGVSLLESCTDVGGNPPMGYVELLKMVDQLVQRNTLQPNRAASIKSQLKAHQMENTNVHDYLSDLLLQLASCMVRREDRIPSAQQTSLYGNAAKRGILCLDVSSVTNCELAYSLIFNEFLDSSIGSYYVIMDDVEIGESPTLSGFLNKKNFNYCVSCENIQDILPKGLAGTESGQALFDRVADECQMHILFKQPNKAADMWSNYYVSYKKIDMSYVFSKEKAMQVAVKDEKTLLASELSIGMGTANMYVYDALNGVTEFYKAVLQPSNP